jgi:putative Mn2+ efflux pump MntP
MTLLELILLALALAVDSFSVAAALSLTLRSPRQIFRISFHFGLFQALFAVLGLIAGGLVFGVVRYVDHWVAFLLLAWLGVRMLRGDGAAERGRGFDPSRGWSLILLSAAVSVDAAAAGVGLAVIGPDAALAALLIGAASSLAAAVAFWPSGAVRERVGAVGEKVAGVVLVLLGIKILVDHLR